MNGAQIHLLLNHLPIVGVPIGLIFLGFSLYFRAEKMVRFSLFFLAAIALMVLPTYLSGEGAEEVVEKYGVAENLIENHEETAQVALTLTLILGGLSILALFTRSMKFSKALLGVIFALGIGALGTLAYTAHLGGLIRHPEISGTTAPQDAKGGEGEKASEGKQEDNDKDDD